MRRGTKATWQGRAWPTRGAGGTDTWQEATQVHADARGGATWRGGWRVIGPWVSGPWLECWSGNAKALPHSTFYTRNSLFLFRVGLCSHGISLLQVMWRHPKRQIRSRGVDHVDPSPRDRNQNTCVKEGLSELDERLTLRHVVSRGAPDLHQIKCIKWSGWSRSNDQD